MVDQQEARVPRQRCGAAIDVTVDLGADLDHELRTPLTLVVGYVEMLLEEQDDLDAARIEMLEQVALGGRRLTEAIGALAENARATALVQVRAEDCGAAVRAVPRAARHP